MIEENILDWIDLGDSIQKIDLYKKKIFIFRLFHSLSMHSHFPKVFYYLIIFMFFAQIWALNLYPVKNIKGDLILEVINYFDNIFLIQNIIINEKTFLILLIINVIIFFLSNFCIISNAILLSRKIKFTFLLSLNSFLNMINIYYLNGPNIEIIFNNIKIFKENKDNNFEICSFKSTKNVIILIICFVYAILVIINIFFVSLYMNEIGSINEVNYKMQISSNYSIIMTIIKLFYFAFHFIIETFMGKNNKIINLIYYLCFLVLNFSMSYYAYKFLFYYNYYLNNFVHWGWYYSTWFSLCLFFKHLLNIKVSSLAIICGIIIISIGLYFHYYYNIFNLMTKLNIFETNDIIDIEKYNNLLLYLMNSHDNSNDTILLLGIIERFEEYLSTKPELNEQYNKLLYDKHLQKKFTSNNELIVLSIISIVYTYNIEKSKDITYLTFCMCYFLVNMFKNPTYAIWLCTKIKEKTHIQSYYKYVLMEEIKTYLLKKIETNKNKLTLKHLQLSSVILYNQYVDLFKMKIYDATCSQIEYFDLLKNSMTTTNKTTKNFLKLGEDILNLRKDIFNIWEKIILLNPFSNESERDFMIYLQIILQDDVLTKSEEKKFNSLITEKLYERNNLYHSMFLKDFSSVVISEGCSYNGKIIYTTTNFSSMFLFSGKEILNCTIDDLIPDVVQVFHKYIIEDAIKFSNLSYIFKNQRNVLLKGKNGILFNIHLFVKPCPNLSFGLVYFLNIQKTNEKNIVIILDENLIIHGFTGLFQVNNNFTMNNNYGLSYGINGHHIGIIIPEILYYVEYDSKKNIFTLNKNNIDLKGSLYPLINFQDFDGGIKKILEIIKSKNNDDNKNKFIQKLHNFIKKLNSFYPKPYSVFFKIENHSFLKGKYHYYRIYIINDLFSGGGENDTLKNNKNDLNEDDKEINSNEEKDISDASKNKQNLIASRASQNYAEKSIQINTERNLLKSETSKNTNKEKRINLKIDAENMNKNNKKSQKKIMNHFDKLFNYSQDSSPSSILTKNSAESSTVKLNNIKKKIMKKDDSFYIKLIKYLPYLYLIIIAVLIYVDKYFNESSVDAMIEFLRENLYFIRTKISCASVYNSFVSIKFVRANFISNEGCEGDCIKAYSELIKEYLFNIRKQKYDIYDYYPDFITIFDERQNMTLFSLDNSEIDILNLDIDNWLNLIIDHGMKIIAYIQNLTSLSDSFNENIFNSYMNNILFNTYKYFYSHYEGFYAEDKERRCKAISEDSFWIIIAVSLSVGFFIALIIFFVKKIYNIEVNYLEKLISFTSPNFEEYLKRLHDLKKKFRENDNDEDKNDEDADKNDLEKNEEEENSFKIEKKKKITSKNIKNHSVDKSKKIKQIKLYQKRLEKKRIMSKYFFRKNLIFILKISLLLISSIIYFIITYLLTSRMKINYYKFDAVVEDIDVIYFQYYKIFMDIKKSVENFYNYGTKITLKSSDFERPKFGNSLLNIKSNSIFSNSTKARFDQLYNGDVCSLICKNKEETQNCGNLFSTIMKKGIEQAVVEMSVVITRVLDELISVKSKQELKNVFGKSESYNNYEAFMGKYFTLAFTETHNIFTICRSEQRAYINNISQILLIVFVVIYICCLIIFIYFIYDYKKLLGSFLNFVGIIPSKIISDDDDFYNNIIKIEELF